MRVENSGSEAQSEKSSKVTHKKAKETKDEKAEPKKSEKHSKKSPADKDAEVTLSAAAKKASSEPESPESKAKKVLGTGPAGASAKDTAPASESDKELTQAEMLMDHVNSGKLSAEDKDSAMKRVEAILKKYGKA